MVDLTRVEGLFVGLLDDEEMAEFNEACRRGDAHRSYEGGAGFMGLAKVRLRMVPALTTQHPEVGDER